MNETITLPRSVVEQALDALAWSFPNHVENAKPHRAAFDALRAALEQPKREPMTDEQIDKIAEGMPGGMDGFLKGWGWRQFARAVLAAAPQPPVVDEQEPVAWMFHAGDVWKFRWHHFNRPVGDDALKYWKPLYTRPRQPLQPMTTEMADLGWELHGSSDAYQAWYLAIEWTERAHGIGGEA